MEDLAVIESPTRDVSAGAKTLVRPSGEWSYEVQPSGQMYGKVASSFFACDAAEASLLALTV